MLFLLESYLAGFAPQPAPGPGSLTPAISPGRAASRQLPCAGSSLKVTLAASRRTLGGQDISVAPGPGWENRPQGKS